MALPNAGSAFGYDLLSYNYHLAAAAAAATQQNNIRSMDQLILSRLVKVKDLPQDLQVEKEAILILKISKEQIQTR